MAQSVREIITTMPIEERIAIYDKIHELEEKGDFQQAKELSKTIPINPDMAKTAAEFFGSEMLIASGINLTDAEAKYGKDWLAQYKVQ